MGNNQKRSAINDGLEQLLLSKKSSRVFGPFVAYFFYGVENFDGADRRRVILWNIVAFVGFLSCFNHGTIYWIIDYDGLYSAIWPLYAFGFKLLQQSVTVSDFNPDVLNNPGQVDNFNTRIELSQPLINIDGWKERKAAGYQLEAANFQTERISDFIDLEVTKTYMQLQLAYKAIGVINKANETATENRKIAKNSLDQGMIQNADGSYEIYFGPKAPKGQEKNWLQTVPGKGWNMLFRLYGPLDPWFDKTWRPGDPELVK